MISVRFTGVSAQAEVPRPRPAAAQVGEAHGRAHVAGVLDHDQRAAGPARPRAPSTVEDSATGSSGNDARITAPVPAAMAAKPNPGGHRGRAASGSSGG